MSRPSRQAQSANTRERLAQEFTRAAPLRDLYPQLAEVRVEFEFQDGTPGAPSPQAFSYFPAARGFFRYACPCHSCSGEFDISNCVAELAAKSDKPQRHRRLVLSCAGQRALDIHGRVACPIGANIRVIATQRPGEQEP